MGKKGIAGKAEAIQPARWRPRRARTQPVEVEAWSESTATALPGDWTRQRAELARAFREFAGRLIAWAEALERAPTVLDVSPPLLAGTSEAAEKRAVFCREGEYWRIEFAERRVQLRHRKGFEYIRTLLESPGRELSVWQLMGGAVCGFAATAATPAVKLDQVWGLLRDLESELAEAQANNDLGRIGALQERRNAILASLGERRSAVPVELERARVAVGKAMRRALQAIEAAHPKLGEHLRRTLHLGYFCRYGCATERLPQWVVT